jgi:hypothetical protein
LAGDVWTPRCCCHNRAEATAGGTTGKQRAAEICADRAIRSALPIVADCEQIRVFYDEGTAGQQVVRRERFSWRHWELPVSVKHIHMLMTAAVRGKDIVELLQGSFNSPHSAI